MADVPQKAGGMGEGSAPSGDGASRGNQRRRRRGGGRGRSNASGGKNPDPIADSKADPTAKILENAQHKQGEKDTGGTQTRARNSGSSHRKRGGRGRASGSIDKGPKPIPQPTAVPHAPTTPRTVSCQVHNGSVHNVVFKMHCILALFFAHIGVLMS